MLLLSEQEILQEFNNLNKLSLKSVLKKSINEGIKFHKQKFGSCEIEGYDKLIYLCEITTSSCEIIAYVNVNKNWLNADEYFDYNKDIDNIVKILRKLNSLAMKKGYNIYISNYNVPETVFLSKKTSFYKVEKVWKEYYLNNKFNQFDLSNVEGFFNMKNLLKMGIDKNEAQRIIALKRGVIVTAQQQAAQQQIQNQLLQQQQIEILNQQNMINNQINDTMMINNHMMMNGMM